MPNLGAQLRALAHYRPGQIYHRLRTRVRQRLVSAHAAPLQGRLRRIAAAPPAVRQLSCPEALEEFLTDPDVAPPGRFEEVARGRYSFVGQTVELGFPPDLDRAAREAPSHLWRMNLHYHRFLVDAAAHALRAPHQAEQVFATACRLLEHWMDRCPPGPYKSWSDAWQSYSVSTRILNAWCARLVLEKFPGEAARRLRRCLDGLAASSAAFLESWIEWDLLGNHILRNACALLAAGRWFGGPLGERWLSLGRSLLLGQLRAQILPDGFHEERTPMYHSLIVEDLLLSGGLPEPDPQLLEWATKLLRALRSMLHPDGHFALFNDAAFGVAAPPWALSRLGRALGTPPPVEPPGDLPHAGYYRFEEGDTVLIFDAGLLGPDHLPAHAHCDALSFEYSLRGKRIVVDTGVDRYEAGPERDYQRSTAAHSTLQLGELEQAECFGSFRIGRRPRVWGRRLDGRTVEGGHDGFGRGAIHYRRIEWLGERGFRWVDRIPDTGGVADVRVTLAPGLNPAALAGFFALRRSGSPELRLETLQPTELRLERGVCCFRFGQSRQRPVAVMRVVATREACFRLARA